MSLEVKQFNFLSVMTGMVVLGYSLVAGIGFAKGEITWAQFSGAVGPIAGALLGYWLRGVNNG